MLEKAARLNHYDASFLDFLEQSSQTHPTALLTTLKNVGAFVGSYFTVAGG
jgi:hypothetical protein